MLIAHYPLQDDINDHSLFGNNLTNTNPSSVSIDTTDGKLSSCYKFTGTGALKSNSNMWKNFDTSEFSITAWIKPTSNLGGSGTWNGGLGLASDSGNVSYSILLSPTGLQPVFQVWDTIASAWSNKYCDVSLVVNKWSHVAVTIKGNIVSFYINGLLINSTTIVASPYPTNELTFLQIGCDFPGGDEYFVGKYNDVRIFSHQLTQKEVREVYKTCILHYSFNDPYSEATENLLSIADSNWYINKSNFQGTLDIISGSEPWIETGAHFKFADKLNPELNGWQVASYYTHIRSFDITKKYTISFYFKIISGTSISFRIVQSNGSNYITETVMIPNANYSDWALFSHTFIPLLESTPVDTDIYITGSSTAEFSIANPQLEINDHPTPFVNGTRDGYIYDNSDFGNDGYSVSKDTCPSWTKDSITGVNAIKFDGLDDIIYGPTTIGARDTITVSAWYKQDTTQGGEIGLVRKDSIFQIGLVSGSGFSCLIGTDETTGWNSTFYSYMENPITLGVWHHLVMTYDGSQRKVYLDGVIINTKVATGTIKQNDIPLRLNFSPTTKFQGQMDDVRIYATALSDADILSLYQSRFLVDNNSDFYCNTILENPSTTKPTFAENGLVTCKRVDELGIFGMDYKELPDGSQWAKIFHHRNQGGTVLFTSNAEALDVQSTDKYSKLYLLEKFRASDGKFEMLLEYPEDSPGYNRWKQTSNPTLTTTPHSGVTGYNPISITWVSNGWGGLEYAGNQTLMDGMVNNPGRYYAIGAQWAWSGGVGIGIPGPSINAINYVELWIRIDTVPIIKDKLRLTDDGVIMTSKLIEN